MESASSKTRRWSDGGSDGIEFRLFRSFLLRPTGCGYRPRYYGLPNRISRNRPRPQYLGNTISSGEEPARRRTHSSKFWESGLPASVMKIYPAIDILGGKAVRLKQGRKAEATVYGDPLEMAAKWISKGTEWLHVVDLDGAFFGELKNLDLLRQMAVTVPLAKIQVGGGIRNISVVDSLLDAGIQRVVLGTAAVQDPNFVTEALREQPHNIAIGIDALDGNVQVSGWTENSNIRAIALARKLQDVGARL